MIALAIVGAYLAVAFLVVLHGALKLGEWKTLDTEEEFQKAKEKIEQVLRRNLSNFDFNYHIVQNGKWDKLTPGSLSGWGAFNIWLQVIAKGLVWPFALPISLAFNRGKAVGLKKRQMRAVIQRQAEEIDRIRKEEGWDEPLRQQV